MQKNSGSLGGFTFVELLVVMIVITNLASLAFPAFTSVMNQARKTQAKNDLTQIVSAVNAFYTDYGHPLVTADTIITGTSAQRNADLFYTLRGVVGGLNALNVKNPRVIVFIQPPLSSAGKRGGLDPNPASPTFGTWYDPWGSPYNIMIDGDYNNSLANPYADAPGGATLSNGVIAWSLGKNGVLGGRGCCRWL
jgi:Tfp pilus assembly protein PilE